MNTVWLLISPVLLLMNSAVTNSGAAYVMSLSLHSSTEALTSSKRGSEKDSDIEPEKSSIGEISARISSRPPTGFSSPASIRRWNHASSPTSQSKDSVCRSSRSGTSSGSAIFANETRVGAPGRFRWSEVVARVLVARDDAKMRPSGTTLSSGEHRRLAIPCSPRAPGGRSGAGGDERPGRARRLLSMHGHQPGYRAHVGALDKRETAHIRAQTWTRAAQRGSLAANAAAVE